MLNAIAKTPQIKSNQMWIYISLAQCQQISNAVTVTDVGVSMSIGGLQRVVMSLYCEFPLVPWNSSGKKSLASFMGMGTA